MELQLRFGKKLKELRKQRGLTQEQLAFDTGFSPVHLRTLEHGRGNPTLKTLGQLSDYFHVPISEFLGEEGAVETK